MRRGSPSEVRKNFGKTPDPSEVAEMGSHPTRGYKFGPFSLDPQEQVLRRDGDIVPLTAKPFEILLALIENRGRLLGKDELQQRVWADTAVEEGSLTRNISTLRKLLGERPGERRYIETVPWRGYRFVAEVRETLSPAANPRIDSIAVLPFLNGGGDPEADYLADGITESLINGLAQLSHLKVISRNSTFRYKGHDVDVQAVGRELRVGAVLTGRILPHSQTLIVSTELIDARDNSQIWGERYSREPGNLPMLPEEIAREITGRLHLKLTGPERQLLARSPTASAEAYRLYLKGRHHFHRLTPDSFEKAIECFERAIDEDRDYALAWVGLSDCYNYLGKRGAALEAIARALELDETLGEARASRAFHRFLYDWDFKTAGREFRRAAVMAPNHAGVHHWYAVYLANMERHDEALDEARRAEELDPVSPLMSLTPGLVLYCAHAYDEALAAFRQVLELDPNFMPALSLVAHVCEQQGKFGEAASGYAKLMEAVGAGSLAAAGVRAAVARLEAKRGRGDEARKVVDELSAQPELYACSLAEIYAALGEHDRAFECLETAYERRNLQMVSLKVDPNLDGLRGDARFAALLERMGLAPQANAER